MDTQIGSGQTVGFDPKARDIKLPRLPQNAKVTKRPLLHPAIPSPYAGPQQQKVVYVSTKTPFMGAVKRVEKLLRLSERRLVQSATTIAKQGRGKRKRNNSAGGEDGILDIATEVERQKAQKRRRTDVPGHGEDDEVADAGEDVVIKGTGRAIAKVLEMALWFQEKQDQYRVQMTTGTMSAIDDIEVEESPTTDETKTEDVPNNESPESKVDSKDVQVPQSRLRYTSVLEVAVSLR